MKFKNAGFTLTEVLIALGLSSIIFLGVQSAVTSYYSQMSTQRQTLKGSDIIQTVIAQVIADINLLQINFDTSDTEFDFTLNTAQLPMAWDQDIYTLAEQCPKCAGRAGFKVIPIAGMRGLYLATIRISHQTLMPNNGYKDYRLVIGNP